MPNFIGPNMRFVQRLNGLCGQTCRNGPEIMYTAAFGNTLIVGYQAIRSQYVSVGHVATFELNSGKASNLISDITFPYCYKMGGITTNKDGSVIGVLCRGYIDTDPLSKGDPPGTISFIDKYKNNNNCTDWKGNCYPMGWYSDLDSPLYLLEFTGGKVTDTPNSIVLVNHATGGWNYGHLSIDINSDSSVYFLDIKITLGPSATNRHEGDIHFGIFRSNWTRKSLTDGFACGPGHTISNRLAYNSVLDSFSRYCMIDTRHEVRWGTTPTPSNSDALILTPDDGTTYNFNGGSMNIVSLGSKGWMASAVGPDIQQYNKTKETTIGTIRLPNTHKEFDPVKNQWNWLNLPEPISNTTIKRAGMVNLANFGKGGEESGRLLVGWSPSMATQGITKEYLVQEINTNGNFVGSPLRLDKTGWGEDNEWVYIPATGCVAFPFTWMGNSGPGSDFPIYNANTTTKTLRVTTICPTSTASFASISLLLLFLILFFA